MPPSVDDCVDTIQSNGGNGLVTINPDNSVTCTVGDPGGECTMDINGGACYGTPSGEEGNQCGGGSAYGTINGAPTCVGSAGSQQAGTSDPNTWGTATGSADIMWEQTEVSESTNEAGESVTTTTTTTATATETTDTQPRAEAAPYVCEDGRLAADMASCDSAMVCDSGYFLVYGSCVPLPADSTTETAEDITTTTTTTNNDTGEQSTENTTSNTTTPGSGSAPAKVEIEGLDGPCNPSEVGYLDCVAGEPGTMPNHTDNGGQTLDGGFQEVYNRMTASPVVSAFQGVATIVPDGPGACQPFAIDLSGTIIGENMSTNVHCDIAESMRGVLGAVMLIFYTICGFRIFASA